MNPNSIILKDFEKWKNLNKNFSLFDYIFNIIKSKNLSSDIFFAFSEVFWPSFIVHDNYVFLKENFSDSKFKDLIKNNDKIEFWINFFIIDPFFDEDGKEKAEALSKILVNIWQLKLKQDFPNLKFNVEFLYDIENGDYGLTFYQIE
ncbi:hypothetical protein [Candidatus Protochlamydia phocaeensis]|uniref:hypothetical protein n=1 Tax=Candidatus Protochlamydia phocaeensis TaxID=1414722 RepID=UPI0008384C50|nr:hypothetical protein [Candidatus Protochlamydia phocaeensis]